MREARDATLGLWAESSAAPGVFAGNAPVHIAPPPSLAPEPVRDLPAWYRESDLPPLIKSSVFRCGLEFIHTFADGNGRKGRLWHRLLPGQWRRLFIFVPADELIQRRREEHCRAQGEADRSGDCTGFVVFMLQVILDSLSELSARCDQGSDQVSDQVSDQDSDQVCGHGSLIGRPEGRLLRVLGDETLSASGLMRRTVLSHTPAFRRNCLNPALEQGLIERAVPENPSSRQKERRVRKTAGS